MDLNPIILAIPVYFILIGVELLFQYLKKEKHYRLQDAITNISCGITDQLFGVFFKVLFLIAFQYIYENWRVMDVPATWWTWIIVFILQDFLYYWAHRKSHEVNLFWLGHVVHHQSEDYNLSVALRQGGFQVLFTSVFYFPMAFLGVETLFYFSVSAFVTLYQFWIHTESINKMGWFELIFNTPSHHRVHHGRNPKYIDKNHAGVFIIWDKLFGTFEEEKERPTYGITEVTGTWNPIYATLKPWKLLFSSVSKTRNPLDGIKMLFKRPGWQPDYLGGFKSPPEVKKLSYVKYSTANIRSINTYALIQFVLLLVGTSFFFFSQGSFSMQEKVICVLLIGLGVSGIGMTLELNPYSMWVELLRLTLLPLSFLFSFSITQNFTSLNVLVSLISLYSILHYLFIYKTLHSSTSSPYEAQ